MRCRVGGLIGGRWKRLDSGRDRGLVVAESLGQQLTKPQPTGRIEVAIGLGNVLGSPTTGDLAALVRNAGSDR